jgi:hypothetical protein
LNKGAVIKDWRKVCLPTAVRTNDPSFYYRGQINETGTPFGIGICLRAYEVEIGYFNELSYPVSTLVIRDCGGFFYDERTGVSKFKD